MTARSGSMAENRESTEPDNSTSGNVVIKDLHPPVRDQRAEILQGLVQEQKTIDPKYFYDNQGSGLFEQITELPEYYPTRTERLILKDNAEAMAEVCGPNSVLVEPGSGSSEKVRLLLDALKPATYVPMDISEEFLEESAYRLAEEYPWLHIHAICTDFSILEKDPEGLPEGKRVIFYPGSTLGNMNPADSIGFLRNLGHWLDDDGGVLIGIDMHKSTAVLEAAYNDSQGVTARFNLNVLNNINELMGGDFDTACFEHRAFYNRNKYRIEMHLVSKRDQVVTLGDTKIGLTTGETIHTENSYKYTPERFQEIAGQAGFSVQSSWSDEQDLFSVHYLSLNGKHWEP